jgi:hypothetical protein
LAQLREIGSFGRRGAFSTRSPLPALYIFTDDGLQFALDQRLGKIKMMSFEEALHDRVFVVLLDLARERLFHFGAQAFL